MENIKSVVWYTPGYGSCIGIVTIIDENTKEEKSYIGTGAGFDEKEDIKQILKFGSKFDLRIFTGYFNYLKK